MGGRRLATPPDSLEFESSFSLDDPRPYYYIVRPDKTLVPLIAIDEINPVFCIHGLPTSLTANDIEEWNMARCGDEINRAKNYYRMDFSTNGNVKSHPAHNNHCSPSTPKAQHRIMQRSDQGIDDLGGLQNGQMSSTGDNATPKTNGSAVQGQQGSIDSGAVETQDKKTETRHEPQNARDQVIKNNKWANQEHPSKTKNAATPGVYGKKKFCTYWIRTGNCDYVQEGCKYLHVIPDEETRLRIGIRDMPRWAREDIPAPQNEFFAKKDPAANQDWRRKAPPTGHINELPQESRAQPRAALLPPMPDQSTHTDHIQPHSLPHTSKISVNGEQKNQATSIHPGPIEHVKGTQKARSAFPPSGVDQPTYGRNGQQVPSSNDFSSQTILNHTKPRAQHNSINSGFTSASRKSAASSAAESYERQMQVNAPLSLPILATPSSASDRNFPPTQPPISRPLNMPCHAPDKMPGRGCILNQAEGEVHGIGSTQPVTQQNWSNILPGLIPGQVQGASLPPSHGKLTSLPSHITQLPMNSRAGSPAAAGVASFAETCTKTSMAQGTSSFEGQHANVILDEGFCCEKQPQAEKKGLDLSKIHLLPAIGIKREDSHCDVYSDSGKHKTHGLSNNNRHATAATVNGHEASSQPSDSTKTDTSGAKEKFSSTNQSIIMHRRHFVAPGEPKYIAASVGGERSPTSNNADGENKKDCLGKGNEMYGLISTET